MTSIVVSLLFIVAIQVGVIAALLVQRRELRKSEQQFRLRADQAPVLIWTARPDTSLDYLNGYSVQLVGRPLEVLREKGWLDFVHPEDVDRCLATYMQVFEARKPFFLEYRLRHADGDYRWLLATGVPKYGRDGSFTGYVGCDIDITERKNGEDRIRASQAALEASHQELQYLAGRLIGAQEVERARIARDLHDDVSQQLAGVSIAFSGLKQRLGEYDVSEELRRELVELQQQTLKLARNVRQLSHDLHPTVLQHLGLVKGLTSYCGELGRAHGVGMTCTAEGDFKAITPDAALCVYRIAQEALRNVIAHAGASRADVRLLQIADQAQITIADNGRGFDATNRVERDTGLGLVSMYERARIIGGTVTIDVGGESGHAGAGDDCDERMREVGRRLWNGRTGRMTRRHTVLLADDHTIVTDGLSRILREADFDVVGAVHDGQRLIDAATRLRPDVIITDLSMPGLTGLDVLARLKTERLDSKVIVLTMHHDSDLATDAIRGGANGFLLKESAGDELLTAVRHALGGKVYITPTITKDVMERMTGAAKAKEPQLTPRQLDILRLIVKGQRMKEIAANLGLSTRTVEGHKYEMMETLGVTSTAELVRYALDRRLNVD